MNLKRLLIKNEVIVNYKNIASILSMPIDVMMSPLTFEMEIGMLF